MEYIFLSIYVILMLVIHIRISLKELLLTGTLLNQEFLVVKLRSSLRKCYSRLHDFVSCFVLNIFYSQLNE